MTVFTAPLGLPVSLEDIKRHIRITHNNDDLYLTDLLHSVTDYIQDIVSKQYITATRIYTLGQFPSCSFIALPNSPIQSIVTFQYMSAVDESGFSVWTNVDSGSYYLVKDRIPGRIYLKEGSSWPFAINREAAVSIKYTCGYGLSPGDVPPRTRHLIRNLTAHWYNTRVPTGHKDYAYNLPYTLEALLTAEGIRLNYE